MLTLVHLRLSLHTIFVVICQVSERRLSDAKMLLTLAILSFGKGNVTQAMKRYFSRVETIKPGCKVTFLKPDHSPNLTKRVIECRNYSFSSKVVSRGTVLSLSSDSKFLRVRHHSPELQKMITSNVPMDQAYNSSNVYVNKQLIQSAYQYREHLGVGVPPVKTPAVENAVISLDMLNHFISWVFSPEQAQVLKQRGHDGERGRTHQLKDYAARTFPVYKKSAESKGLKNISQHNYNAMLKLPIFKRLYMCSVRGMCCTRSISPSTHHRSQSRRMRVCTMLY